MSDHFALHWETEGANAFSKHIKNLPIFQAILESVNKVTENMSCILQDKDALTVVDYGTADGANFMTNLQAIASQVSKKYGDDRQILIQLNDLPSNDFKSVWKNIDGMKREKGMYFATVAQSFYNQCFPSNSVHLALATAVTHFMYRLENLEVEGTICPSVVRDEPAKSLIHSAVEKEWQEFLLLRAKELASGGILVCSCLGTDDAADLVWQRTVFDPLDTAWQILYKDGHISENEMEAGFVPIIIRSASEHKKPFMDQDSPVSRAGLELIHFEALQYSWMDYCKHEGKATVKNQQDILKELAEIRTGCFKAIYYPHVYRCLETNRSENQRKEIMEKFFQKLTEHFSSSQMWLDFPDDSVFHLMIIKKK